jgi:hypothetical protein
MNTLARTLDWTSKKKRFCLWDDEQAWASGGIVELIRKRERERDDMENEMKVEIVDWTRTKEEEDNY